MSVSIARVILVLLLLAPKPKTSTLSTRPPSGGPPPTQSTKVPGGGGASRRGGLPTSTDRAGRSRAHTSLTSISQNPQAPAARGGRPETRVPHRHPDPSTHPRPPPPQPRTGPLGGSHQPPHSLSRYLYFFIGHMAFITARASPQCVLYYVTQFLNSSRTIRIMSRTPEVPTKKAERQATSDANGSDCVTYQCKVYTQQRVRRESRMTPPRAFVVIGSKTSGIVDFWMI